MDHRAEIDFRDIVVAAFSLHDILNARNLCIAAGFPLSEKRGSPTSSFDGAFHHTEMLLRDSISRQVRAGHVPLKVCIDVVVHIFEVGRVCAVPVKSFVITRIQHTLRFHLDGRQDADAVNVADQCGLPVNRLNNALQCIVSRNRIAESFATDLRNGVRKAGIVRFDVQRKLHMTVQSTTLLSFLFLPP